MPNDPFCTTCQSLICTCRCRQCYQPPTGCICESGFQTIQAPGRMEGRWVRVDYGRQNTVEAEIARLGNFDRVIVSRTRDQQVFEPFLDAVPPPPVSHPPLLTRYILDAVRGLLENQVLDRPINYISPSGYEDLQRVRTGWSPEALKSVAVRDTLDPDALFHQAEEALHFLTTSPEKWKHVDRILRNIMETARKAMEMR